MSAGVAAHDAPMEAAGRPVAETGSCHGYLLCSETPLRLVRGRSPASDVEHLEVVHGAAPLREPGSPPLQRWLPTPLKPFSARLHRVDGDGYGFWVDGLGGYQIDPAARRVVLPAGVDDVPAETRLYGIPLALCFTAAGDLSIHAAVVEVDGQAVVLAAPGRFGKTTLAAAFLSRGYRVLSEDLSRCRLTPAPMVFPGPATLRLRQDTASRFDRLPGATVWFEDEERLHLVFRGAARGDGAPRPIASVVVLGIDDREPRLQPLSPVQAISALFALSFHVPTDEDRARCFTGVSELASRVPVWSLTRRLRFDDLPRVVDTLVQSCVA